MYDCIYFCSTLFFVRNRSWNTCLQSSSNSVGFVMWLIRVCGLVIVDSGIILHPFASPKSNIYIWKRENVAKNMTGLMHGQVLKQTSTSGILSNYLGVRPRGRVLRSESIFRDCRLIVDMDLQCVGCDKRQDAASQAWQRRRMRAVVLKCLFHH